jgi:flagella basal body P-ring formation protein FlgA
MIRILAPLVVALLAGPAFSAGAQPAAAPVKVASLVGESSAIAHAPARLALRPELTLSRDLISYGDLISGLPAELATMPAFRAPALGETGTIQVGRIVEGARAAGLIREANDLVSHGLAQVVVTRAARRIVAADIELAVKAGLQERFGVDARGYALMIDGGAPSVAVEPELAGEATAHDLSYDPRTRRIQARVSVPGSVALRLKPVRITGQLVETVEVVVPRRAIARGETLAHGDVTIERRPRDGLTVDLLVDARAAVDKVARRPLAAGLPLRAADVQREEIVAKNALVTIVYETPGMLITMRGKAGEAGAMGDVVTVTNPQSKRVLQATVIGASRVSVRATSAGRVAAAR